MELPDREPILLRAIQVATVFSVSLKRLDVVFDEYTH
jgi:hypothetical protein